MSWTTVRGSTWSRCATQPREGHLGLQLLADAASVPGALLQVSSAPGRGTHWRLVLDGELGAAS